MSTISSSRRGSLTSRKVRRDAPRVRGLFRQVPFRPLRMETLESRWVLSPSPWISLAAREDLETGSYPCSVSVEDLNRDGLLDIAVANAVSGTVSVLVNMTPPGATTLSFATKQDFATGGSPHAVAFGDINGDGAPDVIVANQGSATVSVLLNTTAPGETLLSFAPKEDISTGTGPISVAVADLNGDGKGDLAVANYNSASVSLLLNTTTPGAATPTFAAKQDFTTSSLPKSVAIGDINIDGKPDLAVAYGTVSGGVSVLMNTTVSGSTTFSFATHVDFTVHFNYPMPTCVSMADFNNDGKPDLGVSCQGSGQLWALVNTTEPGAATPEFGTNAVMQMPSGYGVVATDLNCDGRPDLATVTTGDYLSVFVNTTSAGLVGASFYPGMNGIGFSTGSSPWALAAGDFNADGRPDLVVVNSGSDSVSVFLNTTESGNAAVSMAAKQDFTSGSNPVSVSRGDINGDGRPDLVEVNYSSSTVSVLLNTTTPGATTSSFAATQDFATGTHPASVSLKDLNGDGKPDLTVTNFGSNTVSVLLNTTAPGDTTVSFGARDDFAVGTSPWSVSTGDVNGDGRPDLAVANFNSDTVSVLLNTTTPGATEASFAAKQDFATGYAPFSISIADVNRDGRADLAVANRNGTTASVLLNVTAPGASSPDFAAKQDVAIGVHPMFVVLSDLNADGRADLITANESPSDTVSVMLNATVPGDTTVSFGARQDYAVGSEPCSVSVGDLNGDGTPDLAVANLNSSNVSVLLNTTVLGATSSSFAAKQDILAGSTPWSVCLGDLNGDGKADLTVVNYSAHTVSVLLNTTGFPVAAPTVSVTAGGGGYNGEAFPATDATVTGVAPDGTLASFEDASLSYSYYTGATLLDGAPRNVGNYTVVAHYTSDNPDYRNADSEPVAFSITARAITVTAVANTKDYDGTTSSAATPTITEGTLGTDDVANFVQTYGTKHVGTGKTLTPSGSVNDGNSGNNYSVSFVPITTGEISVLPITVTAGTDTRGYDGTRSAAATPTITPSLASGDSSNFIETYDTENIGTGKTLTPSGSVNDGNSGNNYSVTFVNSTTGSITQASLTVTGITANNKVYDGNTLATLNLGSALLVGLYGDDTVNLSTTGAAGAFATKNVGTVKTVSVTGLSISGAQAFNYSLIQPSTTADIIAVSSDVAVNLGAGNGTWLFRHDTTWQFLHPGSPAIMATGDLNGNGVDDVVMSFASGGLWCRYDNGTWQFLHSANVTSLTAGDVDGNGRAEVIVGFAAGGGTWIYYPATNSWKFLHPQTPLNMVVGDVDGNVKDDVIMSFGSGGLWDYRNDSTWLCLHGANVVALATGDVDGDGKSDLMVSFTSGNGTWINRDDGSWSFFHPLSVTGMASGDVNGDGRAELVVSFPSGGSWEYLPSTNDWRYLHNRTASPVVMADIDSDGQADAVMGLGSVNGLWAWKNNGTAWKYLHPTVPAELTTGAMNSNLASAALSLLAAPGLQAAVADVSPLTAAISPSEAVGASSNVLDATFSLNHVGVVVDPDGRRPGYGLYLDLTQSKDQEFARLGADVRLSTLDPEAVDHMDLSALTEHELEHLAAFGDSGP